MRRAIRWTIILALLGAMGWWITGPAATYWKERGRIAYREVEVSKGRIVATVNSTGTIKPVQSISVGSVVSGPVESIFVDHNADVKKGQLLAKIDPKIQEAIVAREKANVESASAALTSATASLATRMAEMKQAEARLKHAQNEEIRALKVQAENKQFTSTSEMEKFEYDRISNTELFTVAKAAVEQAKAGIKQAEAALELAKAGHEQAKVNLEYTKIISPVDGVVLERKIDPGQTMAAQFQTPELFVVAPDLRKEMYVYASVDEADIGNIVDAERTGQPVTFTVDAYPDTLFKGKILAKSGIRMSSTVTQNVVTYPVVVTTSNPDLKLKPGMTASISFQLRERTDVLRVPNAALRFYPQREQVRPEDRQLLENRGPTPGETDEQAGATASAEDKAELRKQRHRRHVWVVDGEFLRPIEIITGISNSTHTELVSGELHEGQKLVTGIQPRK